MANNELVVTAGLDVKVSEAQIRKELAGIQDRINSDGGLKIACQIDTKNIEQLQGKLNELSKGLNINANVNAQNIQQSINQAVQSEPIKVNVEADIKSGELKRQAKEFKEMWNIGFVGESKEKVKELNAQLQEMLANYDKAMKSQNYNEIMSSWEKLTDFVNNYANSVRKLTPEAEKLNSILSKTKVLIKQGGTDYQELERLYGSKDKITEVLNNVLGIGNWSYSQDKASYGFDSLIKELNSNLFKDSDKISEGIVEGLSRIVAIRNADKQDMAEWAKYEEQTLAQDASYWEARKNAVLDSLSAIRKDNIPAESEFVEILSDEDIQHGQERIRAYTEVLKEGKQKIEALKIQIKAEGGDEIKSISSRFTSDAAGNLDGFVLAVQKSNGEVENLYHKLKETKDETGNIVRAWERVRITGSDAGIDKVLDKAVKSADALSRKMNNLYSGATDQNAARPIKTEAGQNAIAEAYNKAVEAVNALRSANATTFAELDNEAKVAVDNLNNVIKAQRNAETAATKLRTKSVTEIKSEELLNLDQFVTTITNSAIPNIEHLKEEVETLRTQLQQVGSEDKQGLINYLIAFSNLDEEFKTLNSEAKAVKKSLSDLDKLAGNTQFKNNATNENVIAQQANIEALRNKYLALFEEIGKANNPQALQAISIQLSELKPEFDSVTQSAVQLQNTLKSDDSEAKLAAKINNLKNQVEIFANTNRKATESLKQMRNGMTFADEWQRIVSQLKKGNLDENAIRRLAEDLRNFKGEAQSAGLTVNRFFQDMSSQLKMIVQRWFSLYAIIGRVTSALNDLKSVDKILTEIAKSSDVARDSLDSLGDAAFDAANKYGRSVTDYLYGVQEFSRAGFRGDQLTGLTEVSLLAQSAGDIETDLANSYVIATNAAYGLAGSQEKLGEVLDRQNYVTNNYALNMTDLANATKIAASQAAQSGVEIDQMTAALATMISTTQQGGEIAARSLRGKRALCTTALYRCKSIIA